LEKKALGLIETVGMAAALEAADAAVKSANVSLIGYELSKGGGMVTIKLEGDVGAVSAAIQAGCAAAGQINRVYSSKVIPRPHDEIRPIVTSKETVGTNRKKTEKTSILPAKPETENEKPESKNTKPEEMKKTVSKTETQISTPPEKPEAEVEKKNDPDLQPLQ